MSVYCRLCKALLFTNLLGTLLTSPGSRRLIKPRRERYVCSICCNNVIYREIKKPAQEKQWSNWGKWHICIPLKDEYSQQEYEGCVSIVKRCDNYWVAITFTKEWLSHPLKPVNKGRSKSKCQLKEVVKTFKIRQACILNSRENFCKTSLKHMALLDNTESPHMYEY